MNTNTITNGFLPTRESLLTRLKDWDDSQSWEEFFNTYGKLIYSVGCRAGLTDAEAQDVVQETILAVAKEMPSFHYDRSRGSFKSWLLTITRHRIADQFRKKHYHYDGERRPREETLHTALLEKHLDANFNLNDAWDQEWKKNLLELATDTVRQRVSPGQYQLFHLHVLLNLPARTVAQRLGVKLTEVYFAKYKISALVRKEIKRLETRFI
jgi:RNA polymerase sigma factor (sigma-70 family)